MSDRLDREQVLFHSLKHHCQALVTFIQQGIARPLPENLPVIKTMGASQFDMYTGFLSVEDIEAEVVEMLHLQLHDTREKYRGWLDAHGGYRTVILSDSSDWTLRFAERFDFVHIHPSRYSPYTVRIKANAMKTVMIYLLSQGWQKAVPDFDMLNRLRGEYLSLSPVLAGGNNDELFKVYRLIVSGLRGR
ncbi:hypothetical protein ACTHGU_10320 [Chitinophagaceae bacterium MMS25-I14]